MKRFRIELFNVQTEKIELFFVEANNALEATKLINEEGYKTISFLEVASYNDGTKREQLQGSKISS